MNEAAEKKECDRKDNVSSVPKLIAAWSWQSGDSIFSELKEESSLLAALGYSNPQTMPRIISLVGGGGKTTTMNRLAAELAEKGFRVLVTTTTHIGCPKQGQVCKAEHIEELLNVTWESCILTAGKPVNGGEKLTMMAGFDNPALLEELLKEIDFILIEADGAKGLPLKVPADHEPVFLAQTGLVIACAGLSALGKPFGDTCFRFDKQGDWLMRHSQDQIEPEDISLILMDQRGSRKNLDGRYYKIILNQADEESDLEHARQVICALPRKLQSDAVVTRYRK